MLVWKGWGLLTLFIPLTCSYLMQFIINSYFGDGFYTAESWPMPLAFFLSSIPIFLMGLKLNNKPGRIVIDPKNNETLELKTTHSFFWIPMQYWSVIIIGIGIWMYLSNAGIIYNNQ